MERELKTIEQLSLDKNLLFKIRFEIKIHREHRMEKYSEAVL